MSIQRVRQPITLISTDSRKTSWSRNNVNCHASSSNLPTGSNKRKRYQGYRAKSNGSAWTGCTRRHTVLPKTAMLSLWKIWIFAVWPSASILVRTCMTTASACFETCSPTSWRTGARFSSCWTSGSRPARPVRIVVPCMSILSCRTEYLPVRNAVW